MATTMVTDLAKLDIIYKKQRMLEAGRCMLQTWRRMLTTGRYMLQNVMCMPSTGRCMPKACIC